MTLEDFRRRWLRQLDEPRSAAPASRSGTLVFCPPADGPVVPRMIFRERAIQLRSDREPLRRRLSNYLIWAFALIALLAGVAKTLDATFNYVPVYFDKYIDRVY